MIQRGELPAEVIELEHERSVMNAQITATQSGARCSFATNSEGLLIAAQQLIFASYARIPIVIVVAHRALEPPAIVRSDDQDTIMYRDIHWMHYHCENAQDVMDTVIQAYKVSEDPGGAAAGLCYLRRVGSVAQQLSGGRRPARKRWTASCRPTNCRRRLISSRTWTSRPITAGSG